MRISVGVGPRVYDAGLVGCDPFGIRMVARRMKCQAIGNDRRGRQWDSLNRRLVTLRLRLSLQPQSAPALIADTYSNHCGGDGPST